MWNYLAISCQQVDSWYFAVVKSHRESFLDVFLRLLMLDARNPLSFQLLNTTLSSFLFMFFVVLLFSHSFTDSFRSFYPLFRVPVRGYPFDIWCLIFISSVCFCFFCQLHCPENFMNMLTTISSWKWLRDVWCFYDSFVNYIIFYTKFHYVSFFVWRYQWRILILMYFWKISQNLQILSLIERFLNIACNGATLMLGVVRSLLFVESGKISVLCAVHFTLFSTRFVFISPFHIW